METGNSFTENIFQSTSPQGRRLQYVGCWETCKVFQSTSPQGRRRWKLRFYVGQWYISIHVSARETTHQKGTDTYPFTISIHVSARETTLLIQIILMMRCISIHVSARETTFSVTSLYCDIRISIHVSARETTYSHVSCSNKFLFQSTSPQGRRRCSSVNFNNAIFYFNPRLRKGDDYTIMHLATEQQRISIHVSARETTAPVSPWTPWMPYFNPRLRKGDDYCYE